MGRRVWHRRCRIVIGIKNKNMKNSLGVKSLCPKDKNRPPFHGEKPLMIKWFLEKRLYQSPNDLHGRDAIRRVRDKLLISNIILQLWADVKYHVPTGLGFSPKARGFYPFDDVTALAVEGGVGGVVWLIQAPA